jgi:hypothetical protein
MDTKPDFQKSSRNIIRVSGFVSPDRDSTPQASGPVSSSITVIVTKVENCFYEVVLYVLCCREEGDMSGLASGLPPPLCQEPLLYSITDLLGRCTNYSIPITDFCGRRASESIEKYSTVRYKSYVFFLFYFADYLDPR